MQSYSYNSKGYLILKSHHHATGRAACSLIFFSLFIHPFLSVRTPSLLLVHTSKSYESIKLICTCGMHRSNSHSAETPNPSTRLTMSYAAPYIESEELVAVIRDKTKIPGKDYVVIDVRDKDFYGGNIPGAINVPAHHLIDKGNELIEKYKDVPQVYFHCALSQQRGPKAARIYKEMRHLTGVQGVQEVNVLRGGFDGWHARYCKEKDLIENYVPSVWGIFEDDDKKEEEDNPYLAGIPKRQ